MQPDLIVLASDAPDVLLIAEVQQEVRDRAAIEAQLEAYMLDNRCSFALLVTPSKTWIYRDALHDFTAASIREEGELDTAELLGLQRAPSGEVELFHAVREWLEHLAAAWSPALPLAAGPRKRVMEALLPAVHEGRVLSGSLA